jgi:hypothetical protein
LETVILALLLSMLVEFPCTPPLVPNSTPNQYAYLTPDGTLAFPTGTFLVTTETTNTLQKIISSPTH